MAIPQKIIQSDKDFGSAGPTHLLVTFSLICTEGHSLLDGETVKVDLRTLLATQEAE